MKFYHIILLLALALQPSKAQMLQVIVASGSSGGTSGSCTALINGFAHCSKLSVDHTLVPSTQTNFTVLVSLTITNLKATGSGGSVTDAQGDDIVFTSDSACTTLLSWDPLESWTTTTGAIVAWVKIASLSSSVNTDFYICYGKAATTTFQGGSAGSAWDTNVRTILHLPNGSSLSLADSTANAYTFTNSSATATTGKIDGGLATTTNQFITSPTETTSGTSADFTWSIWSKTSASGSFQMLVSAIIGGTDEHELRMDSSNHVQFHFNYPSNACDVTGAANLADGLWHYIVGVNTSSISGPCYLYVDGSSIGSGASNGVYTAFTSFEVGGRQGNTSYPFIGTLDEFHYSNIARSADWITTEYNNQNNPGSFITVGAES